MATTRDAAEAIVAPFEAAGDIRIRGMMGGWLVYSDDVLIGQVNEGEFFLKATPEAAEATTGLERRPPYDGAKPAIVIDAAHLGDPAWVRRVLVLTTEALRRSR